MLETLNQLDQELLLFLNSLHTPFLDTFMFITSGKLIWGILYGAILTNIIRTHGWKNGLIITVALVIVIVLCDQIASGLLKPTIQRFRPSRDPILGDLVHTVNNYRGGKYGFASSHASNVFGLVTFCTLLFKRRSITIFLLLWAIIVSYSRIYLGVHYPGDILAGATIGILSGALVYKSLVWIKLKPLFRQDPTKPLWLTVPFMGGATFLIILVIALIK